MAKQIDKTTIMHRELDVIELFCGERPSVRMYREYKEGRDGYNLQGWIGDHLESEWSFATNLSIIEAAEAIAISQVENGGEELI